jgi:hypothetical protein
MSDSLSGSPEPSVSDELAPLWDAVNDTRSRTTDGLAFSSMRIEALTKEIRDLRNLVLTLQSYQFTAAGNSPTSTPTVTPSSATPSARTPGVVTPSGSASIAASVQAPPVASVARAASVVAPPPQSVRRGRSSRRATKGTTPPAPLALGSRQAITVPLSTHTPRDDSPDRFISTLVIADDLCGHIVGRGGRGLKQVSDISGARLTVFSMKANGREERHVSIRGTEQQLGDALVVLGKRIARKRVRAPKKKSGDRSEPRVPVARTSSIVELSSSPAAPTFTSIPRAGPSQPIPAPRSTASGAATPRARTPSAVPNVVVSRAPSIGPSPSSSRGPGSPMNLSTPSIAVTPQVPSVTMGSPNPTPSGSGTPMDISATSVGGSSTSNVVRTAPREFAVYRGSRGRGRGNNQRNQ